MVCQFKVMKGKEKKSTQDSEPAKILFKNEGKISTFFKVDGT